MRRIALPTGMTVALAAAVCQAQTAPKTVAAPAIGAPPVFADFEGSGVPGLYLNHRMAFGDPAGGPTDGFNLLVQREASYPGGMPFFNNEALLVETDVSAGARSFEWNGVFILKNHGAAADGSQDAALQCTSYKYGTGITFCFNAALEDTQANPTTTSVTEEIDLDSVGNDDNSARVNIDVWGRSHDDADTTQAKGIRFNSDARTLLGDVIQFNLGPRGCTNFINDVATSKFRIDCAGEVHGQAVIATKVVAAYVNTQPMTVSGLSLADRTPSLGDRAFVTDAAACIFARHVPGGGSLRCPVYYDGEWRAG